MTNRAEWMKNRKWGIMSHYLHGLKECGLKSRFAPEVSWDECVNCFDVKRYVHTLKEIGAGYVIFTIMQGKQYMCAPNKTFDEITGYKPGEACSKRDLLMEIGTELNGADIDLILYFTGDGPYIDEKAGTALGYRNRSEVLVPEEFVKKWAAVLEEYAVRYGSLVKGWWIDGCYDYFGYNDDLLKHYKDAVLKGNPDAVVAFNGGVMRYDFDNEKYACFTEGKTHPLDKINAIGNAIKQGNELAKTAFTRPGPVRYSAHDDFTAGEENHFMFYPDGKEHTDIQWHTLSFLGYETSGDELFGYSGWTMPGSKYTPEELRRYVDDVNAKGGAVTVDITIFRDGSFDNGQIAVLKALKDIRSR